MRSRSTSRRSSRSSRCHTQRIVGTGGARAAIEQLVALGGDELRFERGLGRLLDGVELELQRRARPS
ncbi:MAG: hypothetical protein ABSG43_07425 [Solirubrobacteraceae bacterium]